MPEEHREKGYKFAFFSNENTETPHVRVKKGGNEAKYWLRPVQLHRNYGFTNAQLTEIEEIIQANHRKIMRLWNEHIQGQ